MAREAITVLAVDDNDDGLFVLEGLLTQAGYSVLTASNGKDALAQMEQGKPDVVLLDVNMPILDGHEVVRRAKASQALKFIPIVMLSANDSLDDVVQGLDLGADDYIKKPYTKEELLARLMAVMRMRRMYTELEKVSSEKQALQAQLGERAQFANIIGKSEPMQAVFSLIEKVADTDAPVLITGESGTGKELVASAIHFLSGRKDKAFIAQNCSAFNENLLESELFGHARGAFTGAVKDKVGLFEVADQGTFFLDELGEMSAALQVKLLRVLQDGSFTPVGGTKQKKVDVRVVAATNRNLRTMIGEGTFREDLFYRISVVEIRLPPLRERKSDIPLLVEFFLTEHCKKNKRAKKELSAEALKVLMNAAWPGNIRQLQNEIERLVIMSGQDALIDAGLISPHIQEGAGGASNVAAAMPAGNLKDVVEDVERKMIAAALERCKGNKSEVARELGISRSNLIAKVQEYGLE